MDDFCCPWCGKDLLEEWGSVRISFDNALEAHVEGCEPYRREQHPEEFNAPISEPLCSGDPFQEGTV